MNGSTKRNERNRMFDEAVRKKEGMNTWGVASRSILLMICQPEKRILPAPQCLCCCYVFRLCDTSAVGGPDGMLFILVPIRNTQLILPESNFDVAWLHLPQASSLLILILLFSLHSLFCRSFRRLTIFYPGVCSVAAPKLSPYIIHKRICWFPKWH